MKLASIFFTLFIMFYFTFQAAAQGSDGSSGMTTPETTDPSISTLGATTTPTEPSDNSALTPTSTPGVVKPKTTAPVQPSPISPAIKINEEPTKLPVNESTNYVSVLSTAATLALGVLGLILFKKFSFKDVVTQQLKEEGKEFAKDQILSEENREIYDNLSEVYDKTEDLRSLLSVGDVPKTTLLYLHKPQEKQILLAMKKRSFGKGKWNGVGGKLNEGETVVEALIREAKEEIGVALDHKNLIPVATLNFSFEDNKELDQQSHVFFTEKWEGDPKETEEMSPLWHSTLALPYENMWIDDPHWLPLVLAGKKVHASFHFGKDGSEILHMDVAEI